MRLVIWNANQALHTKFRHFVEELAPDIAVVPECAALDVLRSKGLDSLTATTSLWMGSNPQKGLGVFSFNDYAVKLAPRVEDRIEWIAPVEVDGPVSFRLLAVWSMNHRADQRLEPHALASLAALDVYRDWYSGHPLVMAGDFNSNVIWNRPRATARDHTNTVAACEEAGLVSAYHHWTGDEQGEERAPTIYWRNRTLDGPKYHIDYAFVPREWASRITSMQVGTHADWVATKFSDHVPLVFDFDVVSSTSGASA